jgi:hypothetical protein
MSLRNPPDISSFRKRKLGRQVVGRVYKLCRCQLGLHPAEFARDASDRGVRSRLDALAADAQWVNNLGC